MIKFILRRLIIIPIALILIHFLAFSYAYIARPIRAARTPYVAQTESAPLWPSYKEHIQNIINGELGNMPGGQGEFSEAIKRTTIASLGLLSVAIILSIVFGLAFGLMAVRSEPPGTARWMTFFSTIGLATPSFYLGSLFILGIVFYVLWKGPGTETPLPVKGFGWDTHLVLPVLALMILPMVQIAQVTSEVLTGELGKQYIVAARSFGHTWRGIRWRHAMRNIMAAVILAIAGSFRIMVGELIVVEWLFNWPGLGNLLASTLVPGTLSSNLGATPLFLDPPVVAAVITIIAALFLFLDLFVSVLVRIVDPRLRPQEPGDS
jgi:peptide/nickel transport system permease protein